MIPHPPKWVRTALLELDGSSGSQKSLSSCGITRLFSHHAGSRPFGILCSLRDLSPLPAGPSRVSRRSDQPRPKSWYDRPHNLVLSYRALVQELVSPLGDPSSREIHSYLVCPPADVPPMRPLPGAEAPFGSTVPTVESRSAFVVSHHHDGFLRTRVTGLLHPATGQGFAAFRASQPQCNPKATLDTVGSPREAFHTLRRVPLVCSRTASLRPLPSCRFRPPPGTPTSRSQEAYRPSPTEAESGRLCALPPKRVSSPTQCFVTSIPRGGWATVRDEASAPAPEGAGLPTANGAGWTAEAQDEIRMR